MTELLSDCLTLVLSLLASILDVVNSIIGFLVAAAIHLHIDAPRLEGFLIGVLLAWVLLRRDKHPLLRVLSAPLKLMVDILDLAWDQIVEVITDMWLTAVRRVRQPAVWCWDRATGLWSSMLMSLESIELKLRRKQSKEVSKEEE